MCRIFILSAFIYLLNIGTGLGQFSIRPQVGVNFAQLDYQSIHGSIKGKTGLHVGVDVQIGGTLYIQPGLQVSTSKFEINNFGEFSVTEINVPIMLGYRLFKNTLPDLLGLRVFAGPELAYAVQKKFKGLFTDISQEDIQDFQAAGLVGAGLDVSIFFVDIGYKFGLSDYIKTDKASSSVDYFYGNTGLRIGF